MKSVDYQDRRIRIKTGDLLVWKKDQHNKLSNFFLGTVRLFTRSEFAHVGIAWRFGNRLFVIEATIPQVRIIPVSVKDEFYHIPMDVTITPEAEEFIFAQIGKPYSVFDAVKAYMGNTLEDQDRYQCAELVMAFYRKVRVVLECLAIPEEVVHAVLSTSETSITLVKSS